MKPVLHSNSRNFNSQNKIIAFNFPTHCPLGFHDITALLLLKAELLLFEKIGQCSDFMKSNMAAHGKFKSPDWFIIIINCYISLSLVKFVILALFQSIQDYR